MNCLPNPKQKNLRAIVAQRLVRAVDGGRVPAVEVLINTPFVADLIENGRLSDIHEAMKKSVYAGMTTFGHALYELLDAGKITPEEALLHANSKNNLRLKLRLESSDSFELQDDLDFTEEPEPMSRF